VPCRPIGMLSLRMRVPGLYPPAPFVIFMIRTPVRSVLIISLTDTG